MILPEHYLMGRDKDYPLDMMQARNMADLLSRVNWLFSRLNIETSVSSGYRPGPINKSVGGAKMSTHTVCAGIDVFDKFGKIDELLSRRTDLLEKCGLWLEHPNYTEGWCHLDTKPRKNRIFIPY